MIVGVVHFVSDEASDGRGRDAIVARLEIVDGLLWALDNFDAISGVVARADDSAEALRNLTCDPFPLSEVQAHHILDMTLRRRTKLSRLELLSERDHLAALL
jgi:DNA gyrase/topoisomerase IV subunit A